MKIVSVVGARPQFVKLAPISHELSRRDGVEHQVVHTGQHYDPALSDIFFDELEIPPPDYHLGVGSGSHAEQTARMMVAIEAVLQSERPDWTLVYGDTNSTLAATLAAIKIHLPVAHLESGLRSFNRRMPEEHNRVLTDHASDLLLSPTERAHANLAAEGIGHKSVVVGDVMADVCLLARDRILTRCAPAPPVMSDGPYVLATLHRADNTDDEQQLRAILSQMSKVPVPVVLLAHPRLVARAEAFGIDLRQGSIRPREPLGYSDLVAAVMHSSGVVTDSGGLQKEAFLLGKPCSTVRPETEWVETLNDGWNILDPDGKNLAVLAARDVPQSERAQPYGSGRAAEKVADVLIAGGPGRTTPGNNL